MVSAEYISANVKFGKNANFFFNKPMAFAGNQLWMDERSDNAKQLTRRLLLLAFQNPVTVKDTDLKRQLRLQMPAIIVKCARAYQTFLAFKGNRGQPCSVCLFAYVLIEMLRNADKVLCLC